METSRERSETLEGRRSDSLERGHIPDTVGPAPPILRLWPEVPSNAWFAAVCQRWDISV